VLHVSFSLFWRQGASWYWLASESPVKWLRRSLLSDRLAAGGDLAGGAVVRTATREPRDSLSLFPCSSTPASFAPRLGELFPFATDRLTRQRHKYQKTRVLVKAFNDKFKGSEKRTAGICRPSRNNTYVVPKLRADYGPATGAVTAQVPICAHGSSLHSKATTVPDLPDPMPNEVGVRKVASSLPIPTL